MLRSSRMAVLSGLIACGSALACGGNFFEENLLDSRALSLSGMPSYDLLFEYALLGKRVPGLGQLEQGEYDMMYVAEEYPAYYAERRAQQEMQDLPPEQFTKVKELRALSDAAAAEAQGAALPAEVRYYVAGAVAFANSDWVAAADYFRRVLALPPEQRRLRSTWAAYSLGRTLIGTENNAAGLAAFRQVRELIVAGFPDPLQLGIASLGEEARALKEQGDWGQAIRLYASQAQHGALSGRNSLSELANQLLDAGIPPGVLETPEVQELLAAHLLGRDDRSPVSARVLALVAARAEQQKLSTLAHADRFAALAYRDGDYASAKRFLALAGDAGMAWWLRAKLAVRDGDLPKAREAYARAARAFPKDETWEPRNDASSKPQCRVQAEAALLTLARGDFIAALTELQASNAYQAEVTELAERVLTVDELKSFVDSQKLTDSRLGPLLGRRLLRAGRYDDALPYFTDPDLQQAARDYGEQRRAADQSWTRKARAEAAYRAAVIARERGMELLGYERSPDFAVIDGLGSQAETTYGAGQWVTAAEVERRNASRAEPDLRYHYRWVAADLARRAADLVPARSQAFGATLCHATSWVIDLDAARGQDYYRRYTREGAYMEWAESFGRTCPEPDFAAAAQLARRQQWQQLRATLRPYKLALIGAGIAILGLAVGLLAWRQRKVGT